MDPIDPVLDMMSRLEQAQRRAEAGSLAVDELISLYDEETDFEKVLLEQADVRTTVADMGGAAQIWAIVAEFNERLSSIIDVIIENLPEDHPGSEDLAEQKEACTKFAAISRARAALIAAAGHRLAGNLSEAEARATEAQQRFESLAKDESAEISASASMSAHTADGLRLGIIATAKLLRFQFQDASITYLQAQKAMEKVRLRLVQSKDTTAIELAGVLSDIYEYKSAAERALLFEAILDGDFEKAVAHADAMVKITVPPDEGILPFWIAQSPKLNQGIYSSYLAYAKAELATNSKSWAEAERHLADSENQWRQQVAIAIDLDIPQGRQIAESLQAVSTQIIGSTRRRIKRERSLYAQIAQLQAENQQLQDQIYQMAKEPRIGVGMSGDVYNVRDVKGQVGSNNRQIIENSFNEFSAAHGAEDDLAAQMQILKDSITELVAGLQAQGDPNAAAEVAETFQTFAEESAKKEPRAGTLRALGKALIDSAGKVAKVAGPVASAVATVITIFGLSPI